MTEAADSLEKELTEEHLDVISDDGLTDDIDKNAESYDSFDEADTSTIATLTQALYEDGEFGNPKIKVRIEKVLEKLERDAEYRQGLEEDLEKLEVQFNRKSEELERISNEAQDAIYECKLQAEELGEDLVSKINQEMGLRLSAECLVRRLQRELIISQRQQVKNKCGGSNKNGSEGVNGEGKNQIYNDDDNMSRKEYERIIDEKEKENAALKQQIHVLSEIAEHLDSKLSTIAKNSGIN